MKKSIKSLIENEYSSQKVKIEAISALASIDNEK